MAKPNTYLQLLNAQKLIQQLHADIEHMKGFTLQQSLDMALITLHRHFGFGPDRCAKFEEMFRETFIDYAQMCVEDGKDDEHIVYTQEKVDRALRAACGDDILSFQERYKPENLYLRNRDLKEDKHG